uniref:Transposase InsQ for insertion sequence element IS609 n=1 Tax=Klebsiella pneumoniae TaxID=573 RepID=A0A8B0SVH8_KLEPN|nr:Putative transposase InsQ for insertion sequence element IS609 [Klebsiella pneumoniae]
MLTGWKKLPELAFFLSDAYTDNLQQKLKDLHGAWERCFDKKSWQRKRPCSNIKSHGNDSVRFVNF